MPSRGYPVKIITTDFEDRSPAVDILWPHESYLEVYGRAGLEIIEMRKPLANGDEPYRWVSETRIAPWGDLRFATLRLKEPPRISNWLLNCRAVLQ